MNKLIAITLIVLSSTACKGAIKSTLKGAAKRAGVTVLDKATTPAQPDPIDAQLEHELRNWQPPQCLLATSPQPMDLVPQANAGATDIWEVYSDVTVPKGDRYIFGQMLRDLHAVGFDWEKLSSSKHEEAWGRYAKQYGFSTILTVRVMDVAERRGEKVFSLVSLPCR